MSRSTSLVTANHGLHERLVAHALVGLDIPDNIAENLPNLAWVQTFSAGVDHVDQAMLAEADVALTSASGIASSSIAEFVMARLLEVWKNLRAIESSQRESTWAENFGTEVTGRTILIVGLGSIGRNVARRARAFDMRVVATRGTSTPARSG